jgi:putative ABC transport system permease protein
MFGELASLAIHNLLRARARLAMTAGGVLVGTTAVVILIALTIGLQQAAEAGIGQNASLTEITVYPSWGGRGSSAEDTPQLTPQAVASFYQIEGVSAVIPIVSLQSWGEIAAGDFRGGGQIIGVDPQLLPYLGVSAQQGQLSLNPGDVLVGAQVGQNFADPEAEEWTPVSVDLMTTPLDMRVYNNMGTDNRKVDLNVAAVLADNMNYDYSVIMPMQQVMNLNEWVTGEDTDPDTFHYDQVIVRATDRETTSAVSTAIQDMGYSAGGMGEFLNQLNGFFGTMRLVLGGVGGVALLVAAFGVANTMTMAILERTREIGLMKAVGATDRDVLTVFLIEAALVGLAGGATGVGASLLIQNVINEAIRSAPASQGGGVMFLPLDTSQLGSSGGLIVIPTELALFALLLATGVGIFAGFYPALRAARMTTVVALKTE